MQFSYSGNDSMQVIWLGPSIPKPLLFESPIISILRDCDKRLALSNHDEI